MMSMIHLVKMSPWPIFCGMMGFNLVLSFIVWFKFGNLISFLFSLSFLFFLSLVWWKDVSRESSMGEYNLLIVDGIKMGMMLFILSEVCFFSAFFWGFFHFSFNPSQELGLIWPPLGLMSFNPFNVPLLNTVILVSSGVTVTWAHHGLIMNFNIIVPLIFTLILGSYFTCLQLMEYYLSSFSFGDSSYGSVFFIATGFHGIHVIIGTLFLTYCFFRFLIFQMTSWNILGFEMAIWYWHFVDVIWLFLFSSIYWWGY